MDQAAHHLTSAPTAETPPLHLDSLRRVFERQQRHALQLRHSTAAERIDKIRRLRDAVLANRERIYAALRADLNKPELESELTEVMGIVHAADLAIRQLRRWMKPRRVAATRTTFGTFSHIRYEPKGVCLIIAPWNLPLNLCLGSLISCLAAGNTAILKPSELAPASSRLVAELLRALYREDEVAVFEGEVAVAQALLELPFDHCFFTGSPAIGKLVMAACARHLTSVTLELGGKSPVILDASADLKKAAATLALGKNQNAGQACIAPDYLLVEESVREAFIEEYRRAIQQSYGASEIARGRSADFGRIVNARHFQRLKGLLDDALARGARCVLGGECRAADRYIAPTLLVDVPREAKILEEEIFGPILPLLSWRTLDEAIAMVNARAKPLALYVFTGKRAIAREVIAATSAGDSAINACLMHYAQHNLPFGGVNHSGIGKVHGQHGFKAFSHERSILRDRFSSFLKFAPPYTAARLRLAQWLTRLAG